jgi:RNA polymerase sigma-70 factor (ECF subfamily)
MGAGLSAEKSACEQYLRDPDVRLMLAVRNGDATAFAQLVDRYRGRMLAALEYLVGDPVLAEDLAQEVFLRVYRARGTYAPISRFATWVFRILHHVASNARRDSSRRREVPIDTCHSALHEGFGPDRRVAASDAQSPCRQAERAETCRLVRLAIGRLNERQRRAVCLFNLQGLTYADAAAQMGLSVVAIRSLLSRARRQLHDMLGTYVTAGA